MDIITIVGIAIIAISVLIFFIKNMKGKREGNAEYLKVGDPNAQILYDKERNSEDITISTKDLLELSWKFLYDITEAVLYRFSANAREEIHQCGKTLKEYGVTYVHIIDHKNIVNNLTQSAKKTIKKDDEDVISR